jgi:glycosyltransferase involved in cell wall biosynthesis
MSKPRIRVSIVIPAYNEEYHLRSCLQAIAEQTVRPHEVIVVDNNSTDRTAEVAALYPFVRLIREPRQGRVFARDTGFNAATGDIIGRIDADILLPAEWVAHVQKFYTSPSNRQVAWSGAGYFYNVRLPRLVSFAYALLAFRLNKVLLGHYTLWGSNMAFTREQWQAVSHDICDRLDIHEDLDLAIHLYRAGFGIAYDSSIKTNAELRRVHSDRHELWQYLQWWPRTLRIHGNALWLICWFFGAFLLYLATFILLAADRIAGGASDSKIPKTKTNPSALEADV